MGGAGSMNVPNVGQIVTDPSAARDAIHVAVIPMKAGCFLKPGEHVEIRRNSYGEILPVAPGKGVGVVDPYLTEDVRPGQMFWLFLYPNTVTSLRHVWSHPAFKSKLPDTKGVTDE